MLENAGRWSLVAGRRNIRRAIRDVRYAASGFSLVELLVVIAVIGILATLVVSAINPAEQLNRARDAKRQQEVNRLAKALAAYYTNNNSQYPLVAGWVGTLIAANELNSQPQDTVNGGIAECTQNIVSASKAYCYVNVSNSIVVFTVLQSKLHNQGCAPGQKAYFIWSSLREQVTKDCDSAVGPPTPN